MATEEIQLTLVVPGLTEAPGPGKATRTLLARADRSPCPGASLESLLFSLFEVDCPEGADPPVGAIARLGDGGEPDDGWWFRAAPVHLRPDRDRLLLFGPSALDVQADEAAALESVFNTQFAEDGLHLSCPHPERWYLRCDVPPDVRTHALAEVDGRVVEPFLPTGPGATRWHGLLNEIQMLFYTHPANQARQDGALPEINGFWPWGGGRVPSGVGAAFEKVWSDEPLAAGLGRLSGADLAALPGDAASWLNAAGAGRHLVVPGFDAERDGAVAELEGAWIAPVVEAVRRGTVSAVSILPGDGRAYKADRKAMRRFWRSWGFRGEKIKPQSTRSNAK